jgi:hypothetical protein
MCDDGKIADFGEFGHGGRGYSGGPARSQSRYNRAIMATATRGNNSMNPSQGEVWASRFVLALVGILAVSAPALADRIDPWLGTWRNTTPHTGEIADIAKIEIANPAYGTAKAHAWAIPDADWGTNGGVLLGNYFDATYETPAHYIELKIQAPANGEADYDLHITQKSNMRTAGSIHGTLKRD